MHALLVHGMGRSPLWMLVLAMGDDCLAGSPIGCLKLHRVAEGIAGAEWHDAAVVRIGSSVAPDQVASLTASKSHSWNVAIHRLRGRLIATMVQQVRSHRLTAVALVFYLSGCATDHEGAAIVRDSSGITVVDIPASDVSGPWIVSRWNWLGGAAATQELLVRQANHVVADTVGNVYLLNDVDSRVLLTDTSGRVWNSRGREGAGPGEFRSPDMLHVEPDGTLHVLDYAKNAVVRFAPDGTIMPERPLREIGYPYGGVILVGDTVVIDIREFQGEGTTRSVWWVTPESSTALVQFLGGTVREAVFDCGDRMVFLRGQPPVFAAVPRWSVAGSTVAVTSGEGYEIKVYESGVLRQILRRQIPRQIATIEDVARALPDGQVVGTGDCIAYPEQIAEQFGVAPFLPVVQMLRFDRDGNLWVQRYSLPGAPVLSDIFGNDGGYRGTVKSPSSPVAFMGNGLVVGVAYDQLSGGLRPMIMQLESATGLSTR